MVKNPPANAGDVGDTGSVPGSGRSLEKEMETRCSVLAWRIPWTEEPGGYSLWGLKESGATERAHTHLGSAYLCVFQVSPGVCEWLPVDHGPQHPEGASRLRPVEILSSQSENLLLFSSQAFGNAKTAHNNNSSRFGKFIQVNYLESGIVRG